MRCSLSIAAASLALLQGADAFNFALQRKMDMLADMGLNMDGTPMNIQTTQILANKKIAPPPPIEPEYIQLPLDNFANYKNQEFSYYGTFNNRYWVSDSAYKPGGPVFLYDVGEADAEPNALFRLQNDTSFFKQLVEKYNGIGIVWEHRYYGNSTPGPIDVNTPAEVFRWLTTEQSLADVERFANQFSREDIKYPLTPDRTPWIFVGGSYPAMRAAFMRDQYPDTIFASYASSAPTEARVDMSYYFEPLYRGMNKYGFGNCTKDINAAIKYMDKLMENPREAAKLKVQFLGKGADSNSNPTFADALSAWTAPWQSYGVEGGNLSIRYFCDWLETDPASNRTAGKDGWAKSKGAKFTVDRWASYPKFVQMVNQYLETTCSGSKNDTIRGTECDLNKRFSDPSFVAWTWQYCTQWGYFQSANLGPNQIISSYNSLTHQRDICHRQFPDAPPSLFPEWPRVDRTNAIFGGWSLRPSNTYWSGGEFDPWRTLSPLSAEPFAPRVRAFTNPVPKCGRETSEREVFGYTIPDAQHCYDFRTYFEGGAKSREIFDQALSGWLRCFRPRRDGEGKGNGVKVDGEDTDEGKWVGRWKEREWWMGED